MNIFAIDPDPDVCAQVLDDVRLRVMIKETAQLLSGAIRIQSPEVFPEGLYKLTHANHPVARWVRANRGNFFWTILLGRAQVEEFEFRFKKPHASERIFRLAADFYPRSVGNFPAGNFPTKESDFCNCTPWPELPTFAAYRRTLIDKWHADATTGRNPTWTGRNPPWDEISGEWFREFDL